MNTWNRVYAPLLLLPILLWTAGCSDDGGTTGPGAPAELVFSVSPFSMTIGGTLSPPPAVSVRDEDGNTVPTWSEPVSVSLAGGNGVQLQGTSSRTPLAGIAVFDDLTVTGTGSGYRLMATSGGLTSATSIPFEVHSIFTPASITAGTVHTCALDGEGQAYCWGRGLSGQLGNGGTEDRVLPTPVNTDVRFATLTAYGQHTCGLSDQGNVYCWGSNSYGVLGDGTFEDRSTPVQVTLPGAAVMMDTGYYHTCALLASGEAYCWGANWGALGLGQTGDARASPVRVRGSHDWAKIETGYQQTCGLTTGGEIYCWGPNVYGENGVGERRGEYSEPTPVVGGHRFADLIAGGGHCHGQTCGVSTGGTVLCWGKHYQQHAAGSSERYLTEPTPLIEDPGFVEVRVGPNMVCGFTAKGELHCLGDPPYGMLDYTPYPVPLVPELDVADVALGNTQTCVLTTEGEAYCWGSNLYGQLGSNGHILGWTEPRGVWAPPGG